MSNQQIEAFAMRIGQDADLRGKIEALQVKAPEDAIDDLVALSLAAGTPITAEEWAAAFRCPSSDELDDDDLDGVSGGLSWSDIFVLSKKFEVQRW